MEGRVKAIVTQLSIYFLNAPLHIEISSNMAVCMFTVGFVAIVSL